MSELTNDWQKVYETYKALGYFAAAESLKEYKSDIKKFRRPDELIRTLVRR